MPEDFQPNELRLTHKGATHVPTIRPSQPPNNSRNPRGSYRGDGPSSSYMHNKTAPDVLRQHPLISNPSSVSGLPPPSVVPIPIRHELPKKPSHSWDILTVNPPDELSRRFDRRIRHELPTRPQDLGVNERPLKRPRLDIPPSSTSNQYDTVTHINATAISAPPTRYPEIASKTAGTPSQPSETPDFLDIVISLPIECRRGKPYNKRNRHTWIEAQIEHLEAERGVKLILWDINGPNVRFRCSAAVRPPGDQQVSQPAEANSSLVHLQLGDNSSYEAVEEKSFTHIRSSPPVLVQDATGEIGASSPGSDCLQYTGDKRSSNQIPPDGGSGDLAVAYHLSPTDTSSDRSPYERIQYLDASAGDHLPSSYAVLSEPPDSTTSRTMPSHPPLGGLTAGDVPSQADALTTGTTSLSTKSSTPPSLSRPIPFTFRSGRLTISPTLSPTSPSAHIPGHGPGLVAQCPEPRVPSTRQPSVPSALPLSAAPSQSPRPVIFTETSPEGVTHTDLLSNAQTLDNESASSDVILVPPSLRVDPPEEIVQFHRDTYDKPRRLLVFPAFGLVSVTMRSAIALVDRSAPRIAHTLRLGTDALGQSVDAACLLPSPDGDLIVLGHARDAQQVSLFQLATDSAKLHAVAAPERPRARDKRSGVSALCALPHAHAFATGGYDHQVHLWRLGTAPLALAVPHSAAVHALLAPRARAQLLLSAGADCSVHVWDLAAGRVAGTLRASNAVHHLHEADAGAGAVLLEVAHRELQFEVRDVRAGGTRAVLRFGYETARMPGRYARGDVRCHAFASGDKEGRVRLWDLRRPTEAFQVVPCFPGRRLTQVVFDGSQLVACSEDHELAFMALGGERV